MALDPNPLDDIVNHLNETTLNVEEKVLRIFGSNFQEGHDSYINSCCTKLCAEHIYNTNALNIILGRAWHLENLRMTSVSRNIFQVFFLIEDDMRRVFIGGP